jgi:hypothetical protein
MSAEIGPGNVLMTRTPSFVGAAIRFGEALLDLPNPHNHVIVVSHRDAAGVLWGIQASPGGIGWAYDLDKVIANRWTMSNADQPLSPTQRALIVKVVTGLLPRAATQGQPAFSGTGYDWSAIFADGLAAVHLDWMWRLEEFPEQGQQPPHLVCSALADWGYERAGAANPGGYARTRLTQPADWTRFTIRREWELAA